MANYNKVVLMGNLTRNPELRYTAKGDPMARFGIAVNRSYVGKDNVRKEEVTFVNVTGFGKQAEIVSKHCQKGSGILVDGRLNYSSWEDPSGKKQSALNVVMEQVQLVGRRLDTPPGSSGPAVPVMQESSDSVAKPDDPPEMHGADPF